MEKDFLKEFLLKGDLYKVLNCTGVERRAGMSRNSLTSWLRGKQTLSEKNRAKLIEFLYELGYQINNAQII